MPIVRAMSNISIGIVDTEVMTDHPVFKNATINSKKFIKYKGDAQLRNHGTAVTSIIAGRNAAYQGLIPNVSIFTAGAFYTTKRGTQSATTHSLVSSVNWLVEQKTNIINMSLSGPPNDILESAIKDAFAKKSIIVAAIGNKGPNSKPLFPAAYEGVIAVTAVKFDKSIYRLANQGDHVDFSAPGVSISHALGDGGYGVSSGTSVAAPFVTSLIAYELAQANYSQDAIIARLKERSLDLGDTGFDTVFGHGLIQP